MAEHFSHAALRHLQTAELLEQQVRLDNSAYHYGLVGEMSVKSAVVAITGMPLPSKLRNHLNQRGKTLQAAVQVHAQVIAALTAGRLGGALGAELLAGSLGARFVGWSIDIRYHDNRHCPVAAADLARWKADAVALYNNGVF